MEEVDGLGDGALDDDAAGLAVDEVGDGDLADGFKALALSRKATQHGRSQFFASCQIVSDSKSVMLRFCALNSTPTRWTGSPRPR